MLGDDAIADDVLFVGDEDDDVMALGGPQLLQTGLCILERRLICYRVDDNVRFHQVATLVCLQNPAAAVDKEK